MALRINPQTSASDTYIGTDKIPQINQGPWTLSCWFKILGKFESSWAGILSLENTISTTEIISIALNGSSGNEEVSITNSAEGLAFEPGVGPTFNVWYFAAIRTDSTDVVGYLLKPGAGKFIIATLADMGYTTGFLTMGGWKYQTGGRPFNGIIDDVRVWKRCLREDEIWREAHSNKVESGRDLIARYELIPSGGLYSSTTTSTSLYNSVPNGMYLNIGGADNDLGISDRGRGVKLTRRKKRSVLFAPTNIVLPTTRMYGPDGQRMNTLVRM